MNAIQYSIRRAHHFRFRRNAKVCRYPNEAGSRYFWNRLADVALCTASGVGIVVTLFFLMIMI